MTAFNPQYLSSKQQQKLQILDLFYQTGNWFCHAYNLANHHWYILRLDRFEQVQLNKNEVQSSLMTKSELRRSFNDFQDKYHYLSYRCLVTEEGAKLIRYNPYPDMKLDRKGKHLCLEGKFNPEEKDYLLAYFLSLGKEIKVLEPSLLQEAYLRQLKQLLNRY